MKKEVERGTIIFVDLFHTYTHMYIRTHIHTNTQTHTYVYTQTYTRIYTHMHNTHTNQMRPRRKGKWKVRVLYYFFRITFVFESQFWLVTTNDTSVDSLSYNSKRFLDEASRIVLSPKRTSSSCVQECLSSCLFYGQPNLH